MQFLDFRFNAVFAFKKFLKVNSVCGFVQQNFTFITLFCKQDKSCFVRYVNKVPVLPFLKAKAMCSERVT